MNEDVHIRGALELKGDHVRMQRNVDDDDDDSDDDDGVVLEYNNVSMVWGAEKQHQHTNTLNMYIIIEEWAKHEIYCMRTFFSLSRDAQKSVAPVPASSMYVWGRWAQERQ